MTRSLTTQSLLMLSASPRLPLLAAVAVRVAGKLTEWDQRSRTRRQLKDLDPYLLKDIGLTHAEARKEVKKYFFQG